MNTPWCVVARQVPAAFWFVPSVKGAELFLSNLVTFLGWPPRRLLILQVGVAGMNRGSQNMGYSLSCRMPIWVKPFHFPSLLGPLAHRVFILGTLPWWVTSMGSLRTDRVTRICLKEVCWGCLGSHTRAGRRAAGRAVEGAHWGVTGCSYNRGAGRTAQQGLWMLCEHRARPLRPLPATRCQLHPFLLHNLHINSKIEPESIKSTMGTNYSSLLKWDVRRRQMCTDRKEVHSYLQLGLEQKSDCIWSRSFFWGQYKSSKMVCGDNGTFM